MYIFILIIHIIASLVLIAVILLQAGRGGGLAETFGGGGSQMTIFGQKASAFLTKATTASAVLFLCTSLSLAYISSRRQKSLLENVRIAPIAPLPQKSQTPEKVEDLMKQSQPAKADADLTQAVPQPAGAPVAEEKTAAVAASEEKSAPSAPDKDAQTKVPAPLADEKK